MNTQFWQDIDWQQIGQAATETLLMLGGSLVFVVLLGLPLGIVLFLTGKRQTLAQPFFHNILSLIVNTIRSIPFVILLIVLIPVTVMITGTSLGVPGAIPPLVIASTPFFSRLVEAALREVDRGIIEAVQGMGAKTGQLVFLVLLPEARPGILAAITVTSIALVSEAAMSGVIGGGGLGDLAIRYGYQRFQPDVMVITVALLLVLVQALQLIGDRLVVHFSRR
ncbi:MAG: ABC transporter permease [Verrucomicrobia bacterium]|nr:ABC transporter permease [Verrucomicrobiota bacterium]